MSKYFTCIQCAHIISELEQKSLVAKVDCPTCGRHDTFGPGIFVEDFDGYTMKEVVKIRASRAARYKPQQAPSNV